MTDATPPCVLKIGGSLQDHAERICSMLLEHDFPVLIVPGGGVYADEVRRSNVTGSVAHWMAVAAMEQYGWYLSSFGIPTTPALCIPSHPVILLPYCPLIAIDPLPHRWEVTSDTIAAWCAHTLHIPLVLLKSVDGIHSGGVLCQTIEAPLPTGDVDPCFIPYVLEHGIPTWVVSGRDTERVFAVLTGHPTTGTTIGF